MGYRSLSIIRRFVPLYCSLSEIHWMKSTISLCVLHIFLALHCIYPAEDRAKFSTMCIKLDLSFRFHTIRKYYFSSSDKTRKRCVCVRCTCVCGAFNKGPSGKRCVCVRCTCVCGASNKGPSGKRCVCVVPPIKDPLERGVCVCVVPPIKDPLGRGEGTGTRVWYSINIY